MKEISLKSFLYKRKDFLENAVLLHLVRSLPPSEKISYYQDGAECDFVIQREDKVIQLIQVTWSMYDNETRSREIRGLLAASSAIGRDNLLIVTMDEKTVIKQSGKDIHVNRN